MTKEDKELLIKDLCPRLPYGVKFECNENVYTAKGLDLIVTDEGNWEYAVTAKDFVAIEIDFIKPYLFPLSSMTEEQRNEYHELLYNPKHGIDIDYFDWCHKNHLDCRGLIPMGLAINATGLNIY
jgi:hypothetical protein